MAWNFENDNLLNGIFWCSEAKPVEVIYLSLDVQSDIQLSVNTTICIMYLLLKDAEGFANLLAE